MDEEFAEPDIYWLFQQVMANGHAEMFTNSKIVPKSLENYKSQNIEDRNLSNILLRCKRIVEYLSHIDKEIFNLFKFHKIEL
jgi:hypothetical protein